MIKHTSRIILLLLAFFFLTGATQWMRELAIGSATLDASSVFDINSTTKGSRPFPTMTEAERDAISTPATGLTVFNSTAGETQQYNGSAWVPLGGADFSAIAEDVLPSASTTYDIGSSSFRWQDGYINNIYPNIIYGSTSNDYIIYAQTKTLPSASSPSPKGSIEIPSNASSFGIYSANQSSANSTNDLFFETGNNTGAGNSGNIQLYTGTVSGGTRGSIIFKDGSEGTSGHCWTSTGTGGQGTWQACSGGASWSDPVNANIVPDTDDAYTLGSSSNKFSDLYTNYADVTTTNLFSTTWGTTIPSIIIDGTGSEAVSASAAGIVLDSTNSLSSFLVGTKDISSGTSSDFYLFTGSGTSTANSGTIYLKSGDGANGGSGQVVISSGTSSTSSTGAVTLSSGNTGSGNSGNLTIKTGTAGSTRGSIKIQDGTEGTGGKCILSESTDGQIVWGECPQVGFENIETDAFAQSRVAWNEYNDSSADMVDGTGGTPVASFTPSASFGFTGIGTGIHAGAHAFVKAGNLQGAGISKDYTVPQAAKDAGYLYVSGYYTSDTTFSTGDYTINAYDVTNGALLPIYGIPDGHLTGVQANKVGSYKGVIYLPNDISTLRIGFHVSTTDAGTVTFYQSGMKLSLDKLVDMPVVSTVKTDFTPNFTNFTLGDGTVNYAWYQRVANRMIGQVRVTLGSTSSLSGKIQMSVPDSLTIDTSYKGVDQDTPFFGNGKALDSTTALYPLGIEPISSTELALYALNASGTYASATGTSSSVPFVWTTNDEFVFDFDLPISEWAQSSGVVSVSNELMNQTSAIRVYRNATQTVLSSSSTVVAFNAENFKHGNAFSFNSSTGEITVNKKMRAMVSAGFRLVNHLSEINVMSIVSTSSDAAVKSTTIVNGDDYNLQDVFDLNVGDVITAKVDSTTDTSYDLVGATTVTYLSIFELPDLSVYAAQSGPYKTQIKKLTADVTTDTTISDLTFSNLEVGKWYEITSQFIFGANFGAGDAQVFVDVTHNSSIIGRPQINASTNQQFATFHFNKKFKAEATTLTFVSVSASANSLILGNNSDTETWVQLSEIAPLQETTEW